MVYNSCFKILIVDDEIEYQEALKIMLEGKGYTAEVASSAQEALGKLRKENFNLVLTDLIMEGMDGLALLKSIKANYTDTEVILITGFGSIQNAVSAMKEGAFGYFVKGHDPEALLMEIEKVKKMHALLSDNMIFRDQQGKKSYLLKTQNPRFKEILDIADKAAKSNASILITGESGVGKEVLAKYIHNRSKRKNGHFIAVNCHAFPETLLESELFGHEKGAFTGALERRIGRFEAAHGGTLFLDEIGEMPVNIQAKLLRTLETKTIERIGSNRTINVDLRLISATNKDLLCEIDRGIFREDLYYRINTISIEVPPLRERREDLPALIDFFIEKSTVEQKKRVTDIESSVMDFLLSYDYPGNIRELKNIIERLVVLAEDGVIREKYLPKHRKKYIHIENHTGEIKPLREVIREVEAKYINEIIMKCNGNLSEAARYLDISRRHLYNKIAEYNLKHECEK